MSIGRAALGWPFLTRWILANGIGFALAYEVFRFFGPFVVYVLFAIEFALMGLVVGVAQWLVLRRAVQISARWVLVTVVGFAIGGSLGFLAFYASTFFDLFHEVGRASSSLITTILLFGVPGPFVGIAQWRLLRHRVSGSARLWILSSTLALGLFGAIEGIPSAIQMGYYDVRITLISALGGVVAGSITGLTMVGRLGSK